MERRDNTDKIKSFIKFVFILFIGMVIFFGSYYTVGAGERGILLTFGKPSELAQVEGLHFKFPLAQSVVKMDVKTQKYEADASAASKDLQVVSSKIAVNYHLVPETVPELYKEIGVSYNDRVIQPALQEVVKASTAEFTAEELITKRPEVKDKIRDLLRERMQSRGIVVEDISIVNFDFSQSFNEAIEAKVTAEQQKLKADRDLERIKVEAQQKIETAKAEAESITIQSRALRDNPDILQLRAIEKWDGKMPQVTGGAMPFINIS